MQINSSRPFAQLWLTLISMALVVFSTAAEAGDVTYQVKASYIYNILQFVSFPPGLTDGNRVNVCILGEDRFGRALDEIDGAPTPSGRINVRKLGRFSSSTTLTDCQVLYIVKSERGAINRVMAKVDQQDVLTISEFEHFLEFGGLIELYEHNDAIRFKINAPLTTKAGFTLDAQLIQLGVTVPDPGAHINKGAFLFYLMG